MQLYKNLRHLLLYVPVLSYRYLPQLEIAWNSNWGSEVDRKYAPNITELPYHVLIIYDGLFCSGSLVSSITVVTTASCFWKYTDENILVKIGSNSLSNTINANIYFVDAVKIHEYYKHLSDTDNDIALILLKTHVVFSEAVKKVILVEPETAVREGTPITVSGLSTSKLNPKFGNVLLWSEMFVISKEECVNHYGRLITPSNFCAKYDLERRLFDNGGPAVFQDFIIGIMSFGGKDQEPHVAVLTNVSYFYRWYGHIFGISHILTGHSSLAFVILNPFLRWIMINTKYFHEKRCLENQGSEVELYSYEYEE